MKRNKGAEGITSERSIFQEFIQLAIQYKLIPSDSSGFEPEIQEIVRSLRNLTQRIQQGLLSKDLATQNQIITPIKEFALLNPESTDDPRKIQAIAIARIALTLNNQSYD
jgi:hypothetical protein